MPDRLLTSLAVRINGKIFLFDAGEGAQLGLKKTKIGVRGLDVLAVSHLHADHCLGIPGLLMLRAQLANPDPLVVLGPPGIQQFVELNHQCLAFYLNYPIRFVEWSEQAHELAYEDGEVKILWRPLKHSTLCLGYRLEEKERPGRFNPGRAASLGVPRGLLWGRLQKGEPVALTDGRTITPAQVLGPPRRGRSVAYVVDTRPVQSIYRLCANADIAFLEGMFLPEHAEEAEKKGHLTISEAVRLASRAGVHRTVLVHISPRYSKKENELLAAAVSPEFSTVEVGEDLGVYRVPLPADD